MYPNHIQAIKNEKANDNALESDYFFHRTEVLLKGNKTAM